MSDNASWYLHSFPEGTPTLDNWQLREDAMPLPRPGELLLQTRWLSVDPYMRGRISPARNYAAGFSPGDLMRGGGVGEVVESKHDDFKAGDIVVSDRCGWQSHSCVDAASARKLDPSAAPVQTSLSVLGMPGLTAYFALLYVGEPKSDETVLVSAASGAVGQVAGQIARLKGCRPVAVCGSDDKVAWCEEMGYAAGINHRSAEDLNRAVAEACPQGVDIYLDNTAGPIHDAAMLNLNTFGRVVVIGTIALADRFGEADIGLRHLRQILITRARIQGFLFSDFVDEADKARAELAAWYRNGDIKFKEDIVDGIEQVPAAFIRMMRGENFGKQLIRL